jgi:hypothetical protein
MLRVQRIPQRAIPYIASAVVRKLWTSVKNSPISFAQSLKRSAMCGLASEIFLENCVYHDSSSPKDARDRQKRHDW